MDLNKFEENIQQFTQKVRELGNEALEQIINSRKEGQGTRLIFMIGLELIKTSEGRRIS